MRKLKLQRGEIPEGLRKRGIDRVTFVNEPPSNTVKWFVICFREELAAILRGKRKRQ